MNIFTFTGNLGKDAEVRHTAGGTAVCSFSVAVTSGYGDKKHTSWIDCALFGKRAEGGLVPFLKKGTKVGISGELTVNKWEKGEKSGTSVNVNVSTLDLLGEKNAPAKADKATGDFIDDEIPF